MKKYGQSSGKQIPAPSPPWEVTLIHNIFLGDLTGPPDLSGRKMQLEGTEKNPSLGIADG